MNTPWHHQPLRIAALQCNFEGDNTFQVIDAWLEAGFNVEQLLHPLAESYTAVFDPALHAAVLEQYLAQARGKGLRIILYQNCHILNPSRNGRHEDWAIRGPDGTYPMPYGTYYGCCVNSPWRDYFLGVLDALGPYDFDGLFFDGPTMESGCFCPRCQALYQSEQGGDLVQADAAARAAFFTRSRAAFVRDAYQRIKAAKPNVVAYWNLPAADPAAAFASLADELPCNDILGTEGGFMFYGPAQQAYLWHPSLAAKLLEALDPHKPRVVFMAADQKPWSWYPHTPTETRLCIASIVAHGANIWYGLHGSMELMKSPGGRAARDMMRFMARHEDAYAQTTSAARVAVLHSYDTRQTYRTSVRETDFYGTQKASLEFVGHAAQALEGVCDALARSSVALDLVTDFNLPAAGELAALYDCLILPTCACLSDANLAIVRQYVREGGRLIATFDTSLYHPDASPRGQLALGDVLGVRLVGGVRAYHNFNYFSASADLSSEDPLAQVLRDLELSRLPAPGFGLDVQVLPGAKVLARFHEPQPGRYTNPTAPARPAMVHHVYGQGQTLYLAGTFAEWSREYAQPEYRRLWAGLVRTLSSNLVELEGGLGQVELVLRRQGRRLIVHLVNYAGLGPRPFECVAPQEGLRLKFHGPWTQAHALMADAACPLRRTAEGGLADLPRIEEYEVVVLS